MFREYYYLNGSLGVGVRCYVALYQNKPIAFMAVGYIQMRTRYYRVSRLVVLPDYQGIGVGKRFLTFIADLYCTQTKLPFLIITSNLQLIRGNLKGWTVDRFGHASKGREDTHINKELRKSLSRNRVTATLRRECNC